ncbi:hypothetical protein OS188_05680 [Xanthomarina sp. F1114]|uniref:hypothetical protein n=1 Tax=Xanthomarina sp. F1114 TaxID=2996019 RepID=UPI00225DE159|nr:hypothetical protein [Xanthomarina sp. F1114]MCX7547443.1 hypothetical protein [Xanthomarina sp. F1114]
MMHFLSYLALTIYIASKIKRIRFDKVVAAYLLIVISINSYFLYELFVVVKTQIIDTTEVNLFVAKSISLLVLAFVSFIVYLSSDTKQAILFLFTTLSFVFSDILHYISNYYIYNWSFVMLNHTLHLVGLFFLFNFVIGENRLRKRDPVSNKLTSEFIPSKTTYSLTRQ